MKRNILIFLLVFCMLASVLAGCASNAEQETEKVAETTTEVTQEESQEPEAQEEEPGQPEQEEAEPVAQTTEVTLPILDSLETFTAWVPLAPYAVNYVAEANDIAIIKELADRTNIGFDFTIVNGMNSTELFNLMIAGGDYTHIISGMGTYTDGIDAAIEEDVIQDVYDLVVEYAPNYWARISENENARMLSVTEEGNLGSLGLLYQETGLETMGYIVNQKWLDQWGMDKPVTYDDMYEYVTRAKAEYDAPMYLSSSGMDTGLMGGFDVAGDMYQIDGQVYYGFTQDAMYDYLQMLIQWYSEGIFEVEFYNAEMSQGGSMFADGQLSAIQGAGTALMGVYNQATDPDASFSGVAYLKNTEDQQIHMGTEPMPFKEQHAWSFSNICSEDDIIKLLKLVNYLNTDEGILLFNYGIENESFVYDEAGEPQWTELVTNNPDGIPYNAASLMYGASTGTTFMPSVLNVAKDFYKFGDSEWETVRTFQNQTDYAYGLPVALSLDYDESTEYSVISGDLETYIEEMTIAWIVGEQKLDEAAWQDFQEHLISMNVERMVEIYQGALDRYNERANNA